MEDCNENTWDTGRLNNFTLEQCDRLTGDEIFIDPECEVSYISPYFFSKWKDRNVDSQTTVQGNKVYTCIKQGGKYYPIILEIKNHFSPIVIGSEFMKIHKWEIVEDEISTPHGKLIMTESKIKTQRIDGNCRNKFIRRTKYKTRKVRDKNS